MPESSASSSTCAAASPAAAASSARAWPPLTEADDAELKAFDLAQRFGPCVGPSRKTRWHRAKKFGLHPPERVLEILEGRDDDDPAQTSVFTKLV